MTMKNLREHLESRPFKPIVVRTVSGERLPVNHPDYLFVPPVGDTILIVDPDGSMHHIDISYIEGVEVPKSPRKSNRK